MEQIQNLQDIISNLKTARREKCLSYQDIVDKTEEIGQAVSLSTVKRVFSEKTNAREFRWAVIKPIMTVVLGVGEETPEPDKDDPQQAERYYAVIEGLKSVVEAKGDLINRLNSNVDYLKEQVKFWKRTALFLLAPAIMFIAMIIADFAMRNVGWIRW